MRRHFIATAFIALIISVGALAAPSAILVDTSRSIPSGRFEEAKGKVAEMLPALTAKGEVAIYAFNDGATRTVDFTSDSGKLEAGLRELKQGGNFTLLYDCLFAAVKDLAAKGQGGLVVLVTDGRDENSAVTLEDAAGRAEAARVGVVCIGMGGAVDAKVLRRLSPRPGGRYPGDLPTAEAGSLKSSVEEVLAAPPPPKSAQAAAPAPAPGAAPAPAQPGPASPTAEKEGIPNWVWLLVILTLLLVALVATVIFLVLKRTKAPEDRVCDKCGRGLNMWETECPECLAKELSLTKPGVDEQGPVAPALPEMDPALLHKAPSSEQLENTIVMDEVPILILQRGKNPPRVFQLPPDQVVSVGRDKVNTISIADQTLSGQHFRIAPKEGVYYLIDLQSTNGTYLNGERVSLKEIAIGSVIHAGQCDFTFKREQRRIN